MTKEAVEKLVKEKEALESVVKDLDEKVSAYEALGTPEKISAAFAKTESLIVSMEELGSIEEIDRALDLSRSVLESYIALGTPESISESFKEAKEFKSSVESKELSTEFGIDIEVAKKMLEAHESFDNAKEVLSGLITSKTVSSDENHDDDLVTSPITGSKVSHLTKLAKNL
ncbi:MAG: hypothetical protein DRG78_09455 [Epsilonproteobacteria bacterium]|nr:MAG: hypothetical protein DRG78_09455 [Campylobacterota bacterium]